MSTLSPNDPGYTGVDPDAQAVEPRRGAGGTLLWTAVLVLLVAVAGGWYSRQATPTAPADPIATDSPMANDAIPATAPTDQAQAVASKPLAPKPAAKPKPGLTRSAKPLASNVAPKYPAQALRSGVEGSVSVRIEIDAAGVPTDAQIVQRSGERSRDLDRAVITAVRKWRFQPEMKNGRAVAGAVVVPVDFKRQ